MTTRPFLVCVHDATPAYAAETRTMIRDLAPFVGRRLCFAVVPNWHGEWPLWAHRDYCRLVQDSSEELLLHGFRHQRLRGWGPTRLFAGNCDEMNGLDREQTRRTVARAQHAFADAFGEPALTFLAPGWQRGRVRPGNSDALGIERVLGFFAIESRTGRQVPLATWTWDCGRWGWLGHVGHRLGEMHAALDRAVPTLAVHPRDLQRGFWPKVLRLTRQLLDDGYEPTTPARLLEGE